MTDAREQVLERLAAAKSPLELRAAHVAVKKVVVLGRKRILLALGALAQTYQAAIEIWDTQKAQGVSREDRITGLAKTLQAAWPKGREEEWKYLCAHCSDYGLVMENCPGDATCGRLKRHLPHEFGRACWCPKGARFRDVPKTPEDAITRAAKTKKPSGWSRIGR